jgi:hypothetical protein
VNVPSRGSPNQSRCVWTTKVACTPNGSTLEGERGERWLGRHSEHWRKRRTLTLGQGDPLARHTVPVGVVLPTHRMAVIWMGVPRQSPTAVDVTVVLAQEEVQRACKSRDERDVRERPAHEVVAALRRPVDQVVQADRDDHAARLPPTVQGKARVTHRRGTFSNAGPSQTFPRLVSAGTLAFGSGLRWRQVLGFVFQGATRLG